MSKVKELEPPIESVPTYLTFSKKGIPPRIKEEVEQIIRNIKEEGIVDDIVHSYIGQ